jgi:CMP-N-acetylneuraminic acid synthetase
MEILALIPARAGSKGIKNKNIIDLNGRPLIDYTIKAALDSKYIKPDNIWCSTDSQKIANIAEKCGASIPFLRPKKLAGDEASSVSVAKHALKWADDNNINFTHLLLLQPTSPLRTAKDIDNSIKIMKREACDSVIGVTKPDIMPYHMKYLNENDELVDYTNKKYNRRQEMPDIYGVNGAIYLTNIQVIDDHDNFYGNKSKGYIMTRKKSVDIDELYDLKLAQFLVSIK